MTVLLVVSQPFSLFSQPSVCPEYSFCLEIDPVDCNKIQVSINGLDGYQIAGLGFSIDVSNVLIDIQDTRDAFEGAPIYQHFLANGIASLQVDQSSISIQYAGTISGFPVNEECLFIGEIIVETPEIDCLPDNALNSIQIIPVSPGPVFLGPDFANRIECSQFTLECPCMEECPIDDWRFCFVQDGCGRVNVLLLGLNGVDDVSGIRFSFTFDPELEIDEQLTKTSIDNSQFLGGNNWEAEDLSITGNTISFFYRNEMGSGTNVDFIENAELLFDIFFKPQPGVCYDFGSAGVDFAPQSGLFIGDHLSDPEVVFCDNFTNDACAGQVCSDGLTLAGNILRPTNAGSCDEAIDFGFPYGAVNIAAEYCGYEYEFEVLTDEEGYYELEVFPNTDYEIIPSYTEEHEYACGVNTIDIDIIRSVILGTSNCFPYPFSNLAADMSLDGFITTYDIALIQRYIQELEYPSAGKWRFIPSTQYQSDFDGVSCPWLNVPSYDTMMDVSIGVTNFLHGNFRAIKMGDVDGSCEQCLEADSLIMNPPSLLVSLEYDANRNTLDVYYRDIELRDVTAINLALDGGTDLQMKEIEVVESINSKEMTLAGSDRNAGIYGWVSLEKTGRTFQYGDHITSFEVRNFMNPGSLEIRLGELVAARELYHLELDGRGVEILDRIEESRLSNQITLMPNPGKDYVKINIPSKYTGPFEVRIIDMMGGTHGFYQTDSRQFTLSDLALPSGTYPILITGPNFSESVKWVKID